MRIPPCLDLSLAQTAGIGCRRPTGLARMALNQGSSPCSTPCATSPSTRPPSTLPDEPGSGLRARAAHHRLHLGALARAALARRHRRRMSGSRRRMCTTSSGAGAGLTPKAFLQAHHARQRQGAARRLRQRARRHLRGRPLGPGPAARSVRHPRGHDAGRLQGRRRRARHALRLPPLPLRRGDPRRDRARPRRPRLRR